MPEQPIRRVLLAAVSPQPGSQRREKEPKDPIASERTIKLPEGKVRRATRTASVYANKTSNWFGNKQVFILHDQETGDRRDGKYEDGYLRLTLPIEKMPDDICEPEPIAPICCESLRPSVKRTANFFRLMQPTIEFRC